MLEWQAHDNSDWSGGAAHSHIVSPQPTHTRLLFLKLHRNKNWKQKRSQQTGLTNLIRRSIPGSSTVIRCTDFSQRNPCVGHRCRPCSCCMDCNATAILRNWLAGDSASSTNSCPCLPGHTSHCICLHTSFYKLSSPTDNKSRENLPTVLKRLSKLRRLFNQM